MRLFIFHRLPFSMTPLIVIINLYLKQCIARKTELSDEQYLQLEEMLERVSDNEQMKAAIHILLGNYRMVSRCINRLDNEQKKEFCSLPIFKLMK